MAGSTTNAAPASPSSLSGRLVAVGGVGRSFLGDLLSIERLGEPFAIESAAWLDHAVEIGVSVGTDEPAVLRIEARTPESKGLLVTEHLNIYFRGQEAPERLIMHVAEHAAAALQDLTLERIAARLIDDPELGGPTQRMPPAASDDDRPRSLLDTWGGTDAYADFFAGGELARGQLDSIDPSRLFRFVQHCDNECLQVNPHGLLPIVSLVKYPWDERLREPPESEAKGYGDISDSEVFDEGMVTTDLTEEDVILGNRDKVKEVLDYALSRPDPDNKAIFFSSTCVPMVTGDDVESVVKQAAKRTGRRIFYLTVSRRSMVTVFKSLLVDRRLEAERAAGDPQPNAINLIGFPTTQAVRELEQLLNRAGISVNVRFLPSLIPETVDELPKASLNVLFPNRTWQHHYDQLTFDSRTPNIMPTAPFGFAATREWLQEIAAALSLEVDLQPALDEHFAPVAEQHQVLLGRAAEHRLGLVVRDVETYFLTNSAATWGVPLLTVLEQMGFGLEILLAVSDPDTARRNARTVRDHLADPERHRIFAFDSFEHLRHRLRESPADAFLTYQSFDWRLTEAGKANFSLQHFEMGGPGAVRTMERLLRICSTPFYRRYRDYLARTTEGLRIGRRARADRKVDP